MMATVCAHWRFVVLPLLCWLLIPLVQPAEAAGSADFSLPNGHFYTQANGQGGGVGQPGFGITDDDGIPFWSAFSRDGGVGALGYPISSRFALSGNPAQATQKAVLEWNGSSVSLVNVLDVLHDAGFDGALQAQYFTPPPADGSPDAGLAWSQVVARHQGFLAGNPALQAAYFAVVDPITLYGLPMSLPVTEDGGAVVVVRLQRAVLQQWLTAQPWAAAGQVTVANAGDLAKAAGLLPAAALTPQPPPFPAAFTTVQNWAGYLAATDLTTPRTGAVTDVAGQWTVPAVDCSSTPDATVAVWVGMGGAFSASSTIQQAGTASTCIHGQAGYYAWLQLYPNDPVTLAMPIQAGDQVAAEVKYLGGSQFQFTLQDLSSGQSSSTARTSPASRDSAEWVLEVPNGTSPSLANFGAFTFTAASAAIGGHSGAINDHTWKSAPMTMVDQNDQPRATPSSLDAGGDGFDLTWQRA